MSQEKTKKGGLKNLLKGMAWSSKRISYELVNTLFVTYISFYATDIVGMPAAMIATVLLITKLFDGVTDLIAGFIVDNTHTKWGKARPYDWAIPFIAIFTILAFSAPKAAPLVQAIYIGFMYVMVQAVFQTLNAAADSVYLLRAFPEEKERNSVFGISTIFSQLVSLTMGVFLPVWIAAAGTSQSKFTRVVILATVPFAVIGMIRFFTIKEVVTDEPANGAKKAAKKEKVSLKDGFRAILENKYLLFLTLSIFLIVIASGLLNTSAAYFFVYFIGDMSKMAAMGVAAYASLVMLVLFVPLANKFGKDKVMKFGLIVAFLGSLLRCFAGTNVLLIAIGMGAIMFGIMPISVYFPLFLFDIMDYSEWKTGKRVEGVLAVFPNFANKVASGISVSLGAFILGAAGYDGTAAVQTQSAMNAINLTYNILPCVAVGTMTLIILFFYNIDKLMPQIKKDLQERKAVSVAQTVR